LLTVFCQAGFARRAPRALALALFAQFALLRLFLGQYLRNASRAWFRARNAYDGMSHLLKKGASRPLLQAQTGLSRANGNRHNQSAGLSRLDARSSISSFFEIQRAGGKHNDDGTDHGKLRLQSETQLVLHHRKRYNSGLMKFANVFTDTTKSKPFSAGTSIFKKGAFASDATACRRSRDSRARG
jgi:hypothetical protein